MYSTCVTRHTGIEAVDIGRIVIFGLRLGVKAGTIQVNVRISL